MKYENHVNDSEKESVLGYLTTFGFQLRKGIKDLRTRTRTIPPKESLNPKPN